MSRRTLGAVAAVCAMILAGICIYEVTRTSPARAEPAPEFSLKDLSGKTVSLSDFKGKVVLVDFWGTYCGPCLDAMPRLQELHKELGPSGFAVLGIAADTQGKVKVAPVAKKLRIQYPILLIGKHTAGAYGVDGIPAAFLVDRSGNIAKRYDGEIDLAILEANVRELLRRRS